MANQVMKQYALYDNPKDYPGKYVIREWHILTGQLQPVPMKEPLLVTESIEECNTKMAGKGLIWMNRSPDDDECIVGVWI